MGDATFGGNPQRTPPEMSAHAGRLKGGSRTAASQSGPRTRTFAIASLDVAWLRGIRLQATGSPISGSGTLMTATSGRVLRVPLAQAGGAGAA